MIGGLRQTGNYLLDCRFNKEDVVHRIRRIQKHRDRIHFSSVDAVDFLKTVAVTLPSKTLVMADLPYFAKGAELYTSFYNADDHRSLSDAIKNCELPWIMTYDNCPEIAELYKNRRQFAFDIQYSAQTKRLGSELRIVSKGLRLPDGFGLSAANKLR